MILDPLHFPRYKSGPPVIIVGDEDGNVSVERVPVVGTSSDEGQCRWSSVHDLRGTQLHISGINT